jgi:hypothetical protein
VRAIEFEGNIIETSTKMSNNDELLPEKTEGFKVGEKKTIDEYHQMGTFYFSSYISYHCYILDHDLSASQSLFFQVHSLFSRRPLRPKRRAASLSAYFLQAFLRTERQYPPTGFDVLRSMVDIIIDILVQVS